MRIPSDSGPQNLVITNYLKNAFASDLYGAKALAALTAHDPSVPMLLYLPWQAVHAPYDAVPKADKPPAGTTIHQMLYEADVFTGKIQALLQQKGGGRQRSLRLAQKGRPQSKGCAANLPLALSNPPSPC